MAELDTNVTAEVETEAENKEQETASETVTENAELAKLRAEMAKQKAALDKATKEAGDYKKQLRAKQSAEEIAAEEAKVQQEALSKTVLQGKQSLVLLGNLIIFLQAWWHQHLKERRLTDTSLVANKPEGHIILTDTQGTGSNSYQPLTKQMARALLTGVVLFRTMQRRT